MSLPPMKPFKKEEAMSKLRRVLFSISRFLVSVFRQHLRFRIWVILIPLLILTVMGKLLTRDGMLVMLVIVIYILLSFLDKWFEKHEEQ